MVWHDIRDPNDPELDRLAAQYKLHPLHIEDCRHRNQAAKLEIEPEYLFVVLKPIQIDEACTVELSDVDFFVGADFLITVQEATCPALAAVMDRYKPRSAAMRPDQLFYRLMDGLVDSYIPILDRFSERMDELEDEALHAPEPATLQKIFEMKRALIETRRVLTNTRDVAIHLQRNESGLLAPDMAPFLRDVYDHIARNLDTVEVERDLLNGVFDLYLNGVANRTNTIMKVMTVMGTVALPALVITGMYGMNVKDLPYADHRHAAAVVILMIGVFCLALLGVFRWKRWI